MASAVALTHGRLAVSNRFGINKNRKFLFFSRTFVLFVTWKEQILGLIADDKSSYLLDELDKPLCILLDTDVVQINEGWLILESVLLCLCVICCMRTLTHKHTRIRHSVGGCVSVVAAYPLHGASGKPSACQSSPQFQDVDASIFVEVQLVKQLSPMFLSLRVPIVGSTVLTAGPREPGPLEPHVWSQTESSWQDTRALIRNELFKKKKAKNEDHILFKGPYYGKNTPNIS